MIKENTYIILASASPRRKELLRLAGFDFSVITADVDENIGEYNASEMVKKLAYIKAEAVLNKLKAEKDMLAKISSQHKDVIIIGADTVVSINDRILGKPKDRNDAFRMIDMLQNNVHQVYTGVALIKIHTPHMSTESKTFDVCTDVFVSSVSEEEINNYIDTGDCFDKAGSYGIQGPFTVHIEKIHGDYFNVVGLPVSRLYNEIKQL